LLFPHLEGMCVKAVLRPSDSASAGGSNIITRWYNLIVTCLSGLWTLHPNFYPNLHPNFIMLEGQWTAAWIILFKNKDANTGRLGKAILGYMLGVDRIFLLWYFHTFFKICCLLSCFKFYLFVFLHGPDAWRKLFFKNKYLRNQDFNCKITYGGFLYSFAVFLSLLCIIETFLCFFN
jgi:hypothetical protein